MLIVKSCFATAKINTVRKLIKSCNSEFSSPQIFSAFLLKITINAYVIADINPQIIPNKLKLSVVNGPLTRKIPDTTLKNPTILKIVNFSLNKNGDKIITITGPL